MTAPELSPAEAATVARFASAESPTVEKVARAIGAERMGLPEIDEDGWEYYFPADEQDDLRRDAQAAIEALKGPAALAVIPQQGAAVQRVLDVPPWREGDPDPTPHGSNNGRGCGMRDSSAWGWVCTREVRHSADWHIAGDGDEVCAVWPVVGQL